MKFLVGNHWRMQCICCQSEPNQQIRVKPQQKPALPELPWVSLFIVEGRGKISLRYLTHHTAAPLINSTVLPDFTVSLKAVLQWKDDTWSCQTRENHGFGQQQGEGDNRQTRKHENERLAIRKMKALLERNVYPNTASLNNLVRKLHKISQCM